MGIGRSCPHPAEKRVRPKSTTDWRRRTRARGELAAYYKMQDWAAGFLIIPVGFFSVLFLLKVTHQDRRRFDRQARVGAKGEFADSLFLFQYRTFGLLVGREYVLG